MCIYTYTICIYIYTLYTVCVLLNPYRTKNQKPSPMLEISCVINWIYPNFYFVVYWCLLIIIRSLVWLQTNLAEELAHLPCCHIIYPSVSRYIPSYPIVYPMISPLYSHIVSLITYIMLYPHEEHPREISISQCSRPGQNHHLSCWNTHG